MAKDDSAVGLEGFRRSEPGEPTSVLHRGLEVGEFLALKVRSVHVVEQVEVEHRHLG